MINKFKKKLDNNDVTFGPFIGIPSVSTAELMGWLGFDFVIIDCEHGPMDYETASISEITLPMGDGLRYRPVFITPATSSVETWRNLNIFFLFP